MAYLMAHHRIVHPVAQEMEAVAVIVDTNAHLADARFDRLYVVTAVSSI